VLKHAANPQLLESLCELVESYEFEKALPIMDEVEHSIGENVV
jgi:hypothetical protein